MNLGTLINVLYAIAMAIAVPTAGYQAYKFVRHEVINQSQKGLPSLGKFSRQLTAPRSK